MTGYERSRVLCSAPGKHFADRFTAHVIFPDQLPDGTVPLQVLLYDNLLYDYPEHLLVPSMSRMVSRHRVQCKPKGYGDSLFDYY